MKNKIYYIVIFLGLFISACSSSQIQTQQRIVVIDAGHGGKDTGINIGNFNEHDIVLSIARKIKQHNQLDKAATIKIVLIRDNDVYVPLRKRVAMSDAANPYLMLSLHANGIIDKGEQGITAYFSSKNIEASLSEKLAQKMLDYLAAAGLMINAVEDRNFTVIRAAKSSSIMLSLGTIGHQTDNRYLISERGQNTLATLIYNGLKTL